MKNANQAAPKKLSKKEIKKEVSRQQQIAKEIIFPILLKHSKNIKNAQNLCKTIVVGMDAVFMQDIRAYQEKRSKELLESLKLDDYLKTSKEFEGERALVTALQGETIATVRGLVEGMHKMLEFSVDKEIVQRPLDSLQVDLVWSAPPAEKPKY